MQVYRCPRCHDVELARFEDASGVMVWFCPRCRGTLCLGEDVCSWLGGELQTLLEPVSVDPLEQAFPEPVLIRRLQCPHDGAWLTALPAGQSDDGIRSCQTCRALFLDAGVLPQLRPSGPRLRAASLLPSLPSSGVGPHARSSLAAAHEPEPELLQAARESIAALARSAQEFLEAEPEPVLEAQRIPFSNPWVDLISLPLAVVWMAIVAENGLGRMLLYTVQIQFHEVGHAVPAWLSSRAALPLPFGFTFWREDRSLFVALVMFCAIAYLIYRGVIEQKRFVVWVGVILCGLQVLLSVLLSKQTSMMLMIAGGIAGELLLSSFVMVAFYFPVVDTLRWDFFRFVLLFPAAGAWVATTKMWLMIRYGAEGLPLGSLLGSAGDGSGDLERLIQNYGFSREGITTLYVSLVWLSGLMWLVVYGVFALRALRQIRAKAIY